jgi:hypothetical protein
MCSFAWLLAIEALTQIHWYRFAGSRGGLLLSWRLTAQLGGPARGT